MQMMMAEKRSPYKENGGAEAREERRTMSHVPGQVQLIGLRDRVQGTRD